MISFPLYIFLDEDIEQPAVEIKATMNRSQNTSATLKIAIIFCFIIKYQLVMHNLRLRKIYMLRKAKMPNMLSWLKSQEQKMIIELKL